MADAPLGSKLQKSAGFLGHNKAQVIMHRKKRWQPFRSQRQRPPAKQLLGLMMFGQPCGFAFGVNPPISPAGDSTQRRGPHWSQTKA